MKILRSVSVAIAFIWIIRADLPAFQADPWAKEMAAFTEQDQKTPAIGGIVFVGSSSIRLWDLAKYFPNLPAINRGFGGSQMIDSVNHADLLAIKHRPRTVIVYAGDNDLAAGKSPQQVSDDFKAFVAKVRSALPETRIAYIGVKPSIQRWAIVAKVRQTNVLIREYCDTDDRLGFIDVDGPMLGWHGRPRKDLFVEDGLHLSPKGYALWTTLVQPFVEEPQH